MTKLFVYGSLMKGCGNHRHLDGAKFLGTAATEPRYELVDIGAFPGMVPGAGVVHGELYEVSDGLLRSLDRFEGCPNFYRRTSVLVTTGSFALGPLEIPKLEAVQSYILVRRGEHPVIESGNWRFRNGARTLSIDLDGRKYSGTPTEIVRAMKARALFGSGQSFTEYVAAVVERAEMMGTTLRVTGTDDATIARSLVTEMIRTGLAR